MAKKKESQKERRARELEERKKKYAAVPKAETVAIASPVKAAAEPMQDKKRIKSGAKAAGLKSVFTLTSGERLMTSFGRGNDAIVEKLVRAGTIESVRNDGKEAFSASMETGRFHVIGRVAGSSDDPAHSVRTPGEDLIGVKAALERKFFGRTFDDSVHIQLIHAIQDVYKILAVYANNIVFTLDNLDRDADMERDDFIGIGHLALEHSFADYLSPESTSLTADKQRNLIRSRDSFEAFVNNPRLTYYGNAFYRLRSADRKEERKSEEEIYYILALMSDLRQACFHGRQDTDTIFRLDDDTRPGAAGARDVLDRIYKEKTDELGAFTKNSAKSNFAILFDVQGADTNEKKAELARQYYRFAMLKENKNTGFSIRTLREQMLEDLTPEYRDKAYDSVRSKLYSFFDFLIWRYFEDRPEDAEDLRASLRCAMTEGEKMRLYQDGAKRCHAALGDQLARLARKLEAITSGRIRSLQLPDEDFRVVRQAVDEVRIKPDASYFTKLIYLMTLFLDGKEINDLLTTLIHAFENIDSFFSVLETENMDTELTNGYTFFARSGSVAKELRAVNSFARMTKEPIAGKLVMFEDAAYLLGITGGLAEHAEELRGWLNDNVLDKKKLRTLPNGKVDTGFRNFIISNVLESRRFRYLVRYGNPRKLRAFMECRPLISLVLKDLPDSILTRYYELCVSASPIGKQKRIDALTDKLVELRFNDFENVNQRANAEVNLDKQKKQALISLYLNVAYQITKNLVYLNSRYTMAYHCLERDRALLDCDGLHSESEVADEDHRELLVLVGPAEQALQQRRAETETLAAECAKGPADRGRDAWLSLVRTYRRKKRVSDYLDANFSMLRRGEGSLPDKNALFVPRLYRNSVAHLSVIRNGDRYIAGLRRADSWFAVYHYLMQRGMEEQFTNQSHGKKRKGNVYLEDLPAPLSEQLCLAGKHGSYCKDLVKVLNIPFAYNLPRYKNLSIEGLVDRNRPGVDTFWHDGGDGE